MKKSFVDIKGKKTCLIRTGKGKKKLIILHGWDQNIDVVKSYTDLINELESQGFLETHEIILPHLPGFGESEMPDPEGWNTHDYAKWLKQFIDTVIGTDLNPKYITFFTHSFGGRILVRFLGNHPNYTNQAIVTASAGIKWPPSLRQKISLFCSKRFSRAKNILPQTIQKIIMNRILGARDWGMVKSELKPTLRKVLKEKDFREKLPKIRTKILLIWGAKDSITPLKSGKVFENKLPNAKLIVFENGKHGIHRTHEKLISKAVIDFTHQK